MRYSGCMTPKLQKKFINKPHNLLVLMNKPKMKYGIRSILKYVSDAPKALRLEGHGALREISINQDFRASICYSTLLIALELETLQMIKSLIQSISLIKEKGIHGVNINLKSSCCQRNQCQYLPKKSI